MVGVGSPSGWQVLADRPGLEMSDLVEQRQLLRCGCLECFCPLQELLSFDGRSFQAPALDALEEDIDRGEEIVQLSCRSKLSCPEPQRVSF